MGAFRDIPSVILQRHRRCGIAKQFGKEQSMKQINMPKYGATMKEGEVTKWLVKVGDKVEKGDPIAEIESEKLSNTLEALESGIVKELLIEEGGEAKVGDPIMILE